MIRKNKTFTERLKDAKRKNLLTLLDLLDIIKDIENHIKKTKPQVVVTHHPGDLNIDHQIKFKAIVASSNKCLEGVPGMAFIISKVSDIKKCRGNSDNLCMDLYTQIAL